jgi:hypothetical protein
MKIKIKPLVFMVLINPLFMSCLSIITAIQERPYDVVMDNTIPENETALVRFMIDMKKFNGIDISKTWYINESRVPHARIPAGQAVLTFNAYVSYGNTVNIARGVEMSYFFEPGKSYTVQWDLEKKPKKFGKRQEYIYGVNVFEGIVKKPNKKKRIDYFPLFDTEERFGN